MPPRAATLRCLLAIALLHQAGAGACGCVEHNGWLQTGRAVAEHFGCDHPPHTPTGDPTRAWDHNDCDASPLVACRPTGRSVESVATSAATSAASLSGTAPLGSEMGPATIGSIAAVANVRVPGLPVRAVLQVFRL